MAKNTEQDFWRRVAMTGADDCWEWQGALTRLGYGTIKFSGLSTMAHRAAYQFHHGVVLPRMLMSRDMPVVMHTCDNRRCCNPAHLRLATQKENCQDRDAKGRGMNITCPDRQARGAGHGLRLHPERAARGTKTGHAKLTEGDIPAVRARLAAGDKQDDIAADYGVSRRTIGFIKAGVTWRHIQ